MEVLYPQKIETPCLSLALCNARICGCLPASWSQGSPALWGIGTKVQWFQDSAWGQASSLFLPSLPLFRGEKHAERLWTGPSAMPHCGALPTLGSFMQVPPGHWTQAVCSIPLSQSAEAKKTILNCLPSLASGTFTVFSHFLFSLLCGFPRRWATGIWRSHRQFTGLWIRQSWTHSPGDIVLVMYPRTEVAECLHLGQLTTANNGHHFWSICTEPGRVPSTTHALSYLLISGTLWNWQHCTHLVDEKTEAVRSEILNAQGINTSTLRCGPHMLTLQVQQARRENL